MYIHIYTEAPEVEIFPKFLFLHDFHFFSPKSLIKTCSLSDPRDKGMNKMTSHFGKMVAASKKYILEATETEGSTTVTEHNSVLRPSHQ